MSKIVLLDGATGTELWKAAEAAGLKKTPVWAYNLTAPQIVEELHKKYIDAGSRIICTNTCSANIPAVTSEGLDWKEVIKAGVKIAKKAANDFNSKDKSSGACTPDQSENRKVRIALDLGPLFSPLDPFGDTTEEACHEIYKNLCEAGAAAGADLIFLETFMDIDMLVIAAEEARKTGLPLFCSMSFERSGKTLYGASPEAMVEALEEIGPDAVGLNCSYGPADAIPVMQAFRAVTDLPLILKPNTADLDASAFAKALEPAAEIISYMGACCGSDPEYIRALSSL